MNELLNKLIEKGWSPRWEDTIKSCQIWKPTYSREFIEYTVGFYEDDRWTPQWLFTKSLREVCSKSSWLWQFVCENGMVKKKWEYRAKRRHLHWWEHDEDVYYDMSYTKNDYEYYLLESALCDEDKLEQFLLDNIKVDE